MKKILLSFVLLSNLFVFAQTWQPVGGGTNNSSHGLLTWDGKLIDLGSFNNPCNRVAQWDGTSWTCLGGGVGIVARAGVVWDGKLVVVGDFWNVQQPCVGCNGVAVWDGVSWTPLGNGVNNDVLSITVWNNEVVIAGDFTQADGVPISRIAKWNGTVWESVGPIGVFDNDIRAMVEFEGDLWVGGDFNNVGGNSSYDGLVKYDPTTANWVGGNSGVDLVGGVDESIRVLYVNPNDGNLYMGGEFTGLWDGDAAASDPNMSGIAMYDGSNWTPLGTGLNQYCRAIHEYNGDIVAGGYFTTAGGVPANKIARWDGTSWSAMGLGFDAGGIDEYVKSAAVWNGIFFAGGAYTQAEGNPMDYISQWYEPPTTEPVAWMTPSTTELCGSGCVYFLDNSTNNPTSWNWSFPGSNTPTSTLQDPGSVCYSSPGTYTATLQACNGIGCNTQNVTIEVYGGATVSVADQTICDGGSVTLVAVPSVPGGTFTWSTGATASSIIVSPASTTNYSVSYTYAGCTAGPAVGTVTVGTTPTLNLSVGTPTICEGDAATLTATPSAGGGTYLWTPGGETTAAINPSPGTTTNYSVSYTLNGCTSLTQNGTVTVNAIPVVTASDASICQGESTVLTATPSVGGGTFLWTPGGATTASITVSPSSSTTYSVEYTLSGCTSNPDIASVTVTSTPSVNVADQTSCAGQNVTLTAVPSTGGGTYLWSPGGETTASINVSPSSTTNYSVEYTLNGCTSTLETATVTVTAAPLVSVNDQTICAGQSAVLTATPDVAGGTFSWSPGGEVTSSISVSPASDATYSVIYTLGGCESAAQTGTVTVTPLPTVVVSDVSVCENETDVTLTAVPSATGGTYLWSPGGEITESIIVPAATNLFSVVYTLNGCESASEDVQVTAVALPDITVTQVNNELTANQSGATYQWLDCNNGYSPIVGETSQNFNPVSNGLYSVEINLNGCTDTSDCRLINSIGLDEFSNETLVVFPNPTHDNFKIANLLPGTYTLVVTDLIGNVYSQTTMGSTEIVSTENLASGVYLILITDSDLRQYTLMFTKI